MADFVLQGDFLVKQTVQRQNDRRQAGENIGDGFFKVIDGSGRQEIAQHKTNSFEEAGEGFGF